MGLHVWFLSDPSSSSILYVCEQRRLWRDCSGETELSLFAYAISTLISWAGSNIEIFSFSGEIFTSLSIFWKFPIWNIFAYNSCKIIICQPFFKICRSFYEKKIIWTPFSFISVLNRLPIWNSQNCSMFPRAFVAGSLQDHWWGFISRNYVVWPIFFLMNVFIALKGTHFLFLLVLNIVKNLFFSFSFFQPPNKLQYKLFQNLHSQK